MYDIKADKFPAAQVMNAVLQAFTLYDPEELEASVNQTLVAGQTDCTPILDTKTSMADFNSSSTFSWTWNSGIVAAATQDFIDQGLVVNVTEGDDVGRIIPGMENRAMERAFELVAQDASQAPDHYSCPDGNGTADLDSVLSAAPHRVS